MIDLGHEAMRHPLVRQDALPTRRAVLLGGAAAILSGCTQAGYPGKRQGQLFSDIADPAVSQYDPDLIYASLSDGGNTLPAVNYRKLHPDFYRRPVPDPLGAPPGTIVIKLDERHLYLVGQDGIAIRYGIGVGRDGYAWSGQGIVQHQADWPNWSPTEAMIGRVPALSEFRQGMEGSLGNPLGARALYIYQGGVDTLYRIHGTPEWWTIGRAMSSGCIRMINQDVIHLASLVSPGARVWVA